jgi:hypothetical protein
MRFEEGDTMPPIALHPENPRYFLFRGRPTVLITSAEHYGAVLNQDFDYLPYLDELQARGFNLTRAFTGAYVEDPSAFGIENNTLAPAPGRLICPWARSNTPGYANGGAKFDLTRWDEGYFRRLRDFVAEAGRRGIVVELVLFCPYYRDEQWAFSPLNALNNIHEIGDVPRDEVLSLQHPELNAVEEAMVRRIVEGLGEFDNLYYEVCNEPYARGVSQEWQDRIIATLVTAEAFVPEPHLIAQNVANRTAKVLDANPAVSIFNFHYASPPEAVAENWELNKPIAFDESGFRGTEDRAYRTDAWEFMLAGGAVYDHLDYSFTCEHPAGTFRFTKSPGGGGPSLRAQLQILKQFLEGFDFLRMRPDRGVIQGGLPEGGTASVLTEPGRAYAVYLSSGATEELVLSVPLGQYRAEWLNPRSGTVDRAEEVAHHGGSLTLRVPACPEDIALRLMRL